jgi:hypothetical protein
MRNVWNGQDFEELLLPVSAETDRYGPRNRPRIAKMLEYIVTQLLFEFFEADGDGLEREYLESTTVLLRRAIGSSLPRAKFTSLTTDQLRINACRVVCHRVCRVVCRVLCVVCRVDSAV